MSTKIPKYYGGAVVIPLGLQYAGEAAATGGLSGAAGAGSIAGPAGVVASAIIAAGYGKYKRDLDRLNEQAYYSDRNANRILYSSPVHYRRTQATYIPYGHRGSPTKPIELPNVDVTAPYYNSFDAIEEREDIQLPKSKSEETEVSPNTEPSPEPGDPKKDDEKKKSKFREEAEKTLGNIGKGYGKMLKGAAYGLGFVGVPAGIGTGVYKALEPDKTYADSLLEAQVQQIIELGKAQQAIRNKEKIDSIMSILGKDSNRTNPQTSSDLPEGYAPIRGYDANNPNRVITTNAAGTADSIITLQPVPDISRFQKK